MNDQERKWMAEEVKRIKANLAGDAIPPPAKAGGVCDKLRTVWSEADPQVCRTRSSPLSIHPQVDSEDLRSSSREFRPIRLYGEIPEARGVPANFVNQSPTGSRISRISKNMVLLFFLFRSRLVSSVRMKPFLS